MQAARCSAQAVKCVGNDSPVFDDWEQVSSTENDSEACYPSAWFNLWSRLSVCCRTLKRWSCSGLTEQQNPPTRGITTQKILKVWRQILYADHTCKAFKGQPSSMASPTRELATRRSTIWEVLGGGGNLPSQDCKVKCVQQRLLAPIEGQTINV